MPAEKSSSLETTPKRWRRGFLYWVSPVLLVSLGLHGLAMLLPLPERDEVVEQEDVPLPEPISVTTLPPIADEEPEAIAPPAAFIPEPAPIIEAPPPVVEPPPVVIQPEPEPIIEPEPEPTPDPVPDPIPDPTPDPVPDPTPDPPLTPDPVPVSAQPQNFSDAGRTSKFSRDQFTEFSKQYGIPQGFSYSLSLIYDAAGQCFDKDIDAQLMVAVNEYSEIERGEFNKKTGYDLIDNWLSSFIKVPDPEALPAYAIDALKQQFPVADANGDIFSDSNVADFIYVARDSNESFVPTGQPYGSYILTVDITVENNNCAEQKVL